MTPAQHLVFLGCVALAAWVQNLTGFALGLVMLGLVGLTRAVPLTDATNVASILTLVNAAAMFGTARPRLERRIMLPTLAASLVGVAAGVLLLGWLSDHAVTLLRLLLGVVIVGCAVVLMIEARVRAEPSPAAGFAAVGLLSGLLGGLFSTAGPPLVYHFYRQPLPLRAIRESLVAVFTLAAVVRLALMLAAGRVAVDVAWLALEAAPLVMALTWWMTRHPSGWQPRTVKALACALLVAIGAGLAFDALRAM